MMSLKPGLDSLLNATIKDLPKRNDFRGCHKYDQDCERKLKDYAYKGKECTHECEYCSAFKWAIDRAKHYEDKLGIPWEEMVQSWEEDRDYWYLNYYQECNQPKIDREHVKVFDTLEEFKDSAKHSEYICPSCGKVTRNAYECEHCHWKVYGLFTDLGKGVFVYIKDKRRGQTIFMPKAWSTMSRK